VPNIYAIGDVVRGAMLHKPKRKDYGCRTNCWSKPHIDYNLIPGVVYTWPEVAAVGQTEEQLKKLEHTNQGSIQSLRSRAQSADLDGCKILADAR
jgi:dihydrolipoamide dehydrogenase